jgi:hypothetical protein
LELDVAARSTYITVIPMCLEACICKNDIFGNILGSFC